LFRKNKINFAVTSGNSFEIYFCTANSTLTLAFQKKIQNYPLSFSDPLVAYASLIVQGNPAQTLLIEY